MRARSGRHATPRTRLSSWCLEPEQGHLPGTPGRALPLRPTSLSDSRLHGHRRGAVGQPHRLAHGNAGLVVGVTCRRATQAVTASTKATMSATCSPDQPSPKPTSTSSRHGERREPDRRPCHPVRNVRPDRARPIGGSDRPRGRGELRGPAPRKQRVERDLDRLGDDPRQTCLRRAVNGPAPRSGPFALSLLVFGMRRPPTTPVVGRDRPTHRSPSPRAAWSGPSSRRRRGPRPGRCSGQGEHLN